jgi:xanthine dehydrogenase accessory factor
MREVLNELVTSLERGRACVACVLVETRGSTPQKAGATMLVYPDGAQAGTLGGGCVEAEVRQRALLSLNQPLPKPEVFTFNLDDDYGWDDGLICGGRMTVLAHPLAPGKSNGATDYFRRYLNFVAGGHGCIEAVAVATESVPKGSRFLFDATGTLAGALGDGSADELRHHLPDVNTRPRPSLLQGVAYLPHAPRVRLLIVGGGHVGQAVGELAARVDFDVWALDDRDKFASRERFPAAQRLMVGDIGQTLKSLIAEGHVTPSTYALIVTRGHSHDEEALYHLATTRARYVGMIGSKRKIRLIFDDLIAKGIAPEILERVHAPLGIPIGSQTVPEIAVSIVAELIQCRNAPAAAAKSESRSCCP